jgi:hypothetical protein
MTFGISEDILPPFDDNFTPPIKSNCFVENKFLQNLGPTKHLECP